MKSGFIAGPFKTSPFPRIKINGLMSVEKPDNSVRPVLNLSSPKNLSVNDGILREKVQKFWPTYLSTSRGFAAALFLFGRFAQMAKVDQIAAYKNIAMISSDLHLQFLEWLGRLFVELCLIMGSASSAARYDIFHELLVQVTRCFTRTPQHLIHRCIDDIALLAPWNSDSIQVFLQEYTSICKAANIELAPFDVDKTKAFSPTTEGIVLGILFSSEKMTWSFEPTKQRRLFWSIQDIIDNDTFPASDVATVTGRIIDFATLLPIGKFMRNHILAANRICSDLPPPELTKIPEDAKHQLRFWSLMVKVASEGFPLTDRNNSAPPNAIQVHSDAAGGSEESNNGAGAFRPANSSQGPLLAILKWPPYIQRGGVPSMCTLELAAMCLGLITDIVALHNHAVVFHIDNTAAVAAWRRGYSRRDGLATTVIKAMFVIAAAANIELYTVHVPRRSSTASIIADDLSKSTFEHHVMKYIGREAVLQGWSFPRPPRSFIRWLKNPKETDTLGPDIISDIISSNPDLPMLGYSTSWKHPLILPPI